MTNSSPDADAPDAPPHKRDTDDGLVDAIRSQLDQDDGIDYERLARKLGPSALDALRELLDDPSPQIAAGAASLAGLIEGGSGLPVVAEAAGNDDSLVRSAVALALPTLPEEPATRLVERLLEDHEIPVRGHALRAAARIGTPGLRERIRAIAAQDSSPEVQELAQRLLRDPLQSAS
jgi:HEAT repeat protein